MVVGHVISFVFLNTCIDTKLIISVPNLPLCGSLSVMHVIPEAIYAPNEVWG